jgi:hypothetical protein
VHLPEDCSLAYGWILLGKLGFDLAILELVREFLHFFGVFV